MLEFIVFGDNVIFGGRNFEMVKITKKSSACTLLRTRKCRLFCCYRVTVCELINLICYMWVIGCEIVSLQPASVVHSYADIHVRIQDRICLFMA